MFGYKYVAVQIVKLFTSYLAYKIWKKKTGLVVFFSFHLHNVHFKASEPFKILYPLDVATVNFFSVIGGTEALDSALHSNVIKQ